MDHGCCVACRWRLARTGWVAGLVEYRAASDDELEACIALQHLAFRPRQDGAPDRYRSYVREDPTYRPGQTRVALVDGQIVGHLRVWDRKLSVRGQVVTAGGIGSLLTHPDHRGQGIASGLLANTEAYLEEVGYDIGLLFTIIGTSYYTARGWTPIPIAVFEIDLNDAKDVDPVECRPLKLAEDLDAVRRVHANCSMVYTGTEQRDEAYWSTGPARYRSVFPNVGIERDGEVCGYVNWDVTESGIWVVECCAEEASDYGRLARIVFGAAGESSERMLRGSLPRDHPFVPALESLVGGPAVWAKHDEMMVKVSRWDLLKEKLCSDSVVLPESFPTDPGEIRSSWRALLGCSEAGNSWLDRFGECPPTFYWWTDIF